jgi:hypothetical protein
MNRSISLFLSACPRFTRALAVPLAATVLSSATGCGAEAPKFNASTSQADTTGSGGNGAPGDLVVWACPGASCFGYQAATYIAGQVNYLTCRSQSQGANLALGDGITACASAFAGTQADEGSYACAATTAACPTEGLLPSAVPVGPGVEWSCSNAGCVAGSPNPVGTISYSVCEPVSDPDSNASAALSAELSGPTACAVAFPTERNLAAGGVTCQPTSTPCTVGEPVHGIKVNPASGQ